MTGRIDIWMKMAMTHQPDMTSIGYGLDRTDGPIRREWRVQLRYGL